MSNQYESSVTAVSSWFRRVTCCIRLGSKLLRQKSFPKEDQDQSYLFKLSTLKHTRFSCNIKKKIILYSTVSSINTTVYTQEVA